VGRPRSPQPPGLPASLLDPRPRARHHEERQAAEGAADGLPRTALKAIRHAKGLLVFCTELEAEAKRLRGEIANLVSALAGGSSKPDALVEAVAERQEKLSTLDARIRAIKTAPEAISTELARLELEARARLADFRSILAGHPAELGRSSLRSSPGP
jgi:hypothetical protein